MAPSAESDGMAGRPWASWERASAPDAARRNSGGGVAKEAGAVIDRWLGTSTVVETLAS